MPPYTVPDDTWDSSPPSTPARSTRNGGSNLFNFGQEPSTTPAGPPPSSTGSFTPAGAPSASYLGSSMMRGVASHKSDTKNLFSSKNSNARSSKASPRPATSNYRPSASSRYGRSQQRQPSRLSKQYVLDDEDDAEGEDEDAMADEEAVEDDEDEYDEDEDDYERRSGGIRFAKSIRTTFRPSEMSQGQPDFGNSLRSSMLGLSEDDLEQANRDVWLDLDRTQDLPSFGDSPNMMDMVTPEVDEQVRQQAENLLRVSQMHTAGRPTREYQFSMIAKSIYEQEGYASVQEAPMMILETEAAVSKLYEEGVGSTHDTDRLDNTLASTSGQLLGLWEDYANSLSTVREEHEAGIGPSPTATAFEHALYLAKLALQIHHTRYSQEGAETILEPLPETMFRWLGDNHNLYPGQAQEVQRARPSPASTGIYWQTVFVTLLQGNVPQAINLLNVGGWERVTRDRQLAYTGRALENVQRAIREICTILETCPGRTGDWDIRNSDWTLFRIRARGAREQLRKFAEGKGLGDSELGDSFRSRSSMTGMARKAESQLPWDIYENINIIFDIILGQKERILGICQDWVEASVGLMGWWDEKQHLNHRQSMSRSLVLARSDSSTENYLERLADCFHAAVDSGLEVNSNNPIEIGMASIFEGNGKGAIGIIRSWSLPVASAVAEIASLGGWLPIHQELPKAMEEMDADDLDLLGVDLGSPDELDGFKDNTLIHYAEALVNNNDLVKVPDRSGRQMEGWELAINVLGRMESPTRSEEVVAEMVRTVIDNVTPDSGSTVEKVWRLLNNLGMIAFAEETAEHYGEVLSQESHRYGEAMWYYALAHRPSKVREVMNLLISYSLINSSAYPVDTDLDDHLRRLLDERNATLEDFAKQDLEAAELLGKMLSGYATLRRFYEIRDEHDDTPLPHRQPAAAQALVAVIASADDNIRGGLYDPSRDAVVSEDFLLALLGEALPFVNGSKNTLGKTHLSADAINTLLKAVEDIQTVGSRVYAACDEFFSVVLHNAPGRRGGSKPADLMRMSTSGTSSFVLTGSSMLASQLHKSIGPGGMNGGKDVKRGWDWRAGLNANTKSEDVLRMMRLGLTRDLARLWIEEADEGRAF